MSIYLHTRFHEACQDLSLAGKRAGMKDTSTRSGLLWEVERILNECENLPQCLIMENVPQIHSKENIKDFCKWIQVLENLGYSSYWQDLNAKNYGIPQNRNRTFMISILGDYNYNFPKKIKLKKRLKDLLEKNVDEKYYISDKQIQDIQNWNAYEKPLETMEKVDKTNISPTLTTRTGAYAAGMILVKEQEEDMLKRELCNKLIEEGKVQEGDVVKHSYTTQILDGNKKCVEKNDGIMITLTTRGDCVGVCVKEEEPQVMVKGNYTPSNHNASRIVDIEDLSPTVMENHGTITAIVENNEGGVIVPEATKKGYAIAKDGDGIYINRPQQKRGVVQKGMIQTLKTQCDDVAVVLEEEKNLFTEMNVKMITEEGNIKRYLDSEIVDEFKEGQCATLNYPNGYGHGTRVFDNCPTITATSPQTLITKEKQTPLRIRKLTAKECGRLMGLKDEDIDKIAKNQSNASQYHLYGDSIVTTCLMALFGELLGINYIEKINNFNNWWKNE